jgi:hypothetical protein
MIKNFKYKFLNTYLKEVHKKSLTLLCIYLISMIIYSFYIQNITALILIEFLLFCCLISCINSIKCNFLYKKFILSTNSEEELTIICNALEEKTKYINISLFCLKITLSVVLFDIINNLL